MLKLKNNNNSKKFTLLTVVSPVSICTPGLWAVAKELVTDFCGVLASAPLLAVPPVIPVHAVFKNKTNTLRKQFSSFQYRLRKSKFLVA